MADYWKSTPKYWCKNCTTYVADTKLGRANHEATGKHQSAVRRALRDLHRDHERQEREQEKARREVARLNGLVGDGGEGAGGSAASGPAFTKSRPPPPPPAQRQQQQQQPAASAAPRDQLEQLAELGVSIPDEFRGDLAMAGDWTVTETRVIEEEDAGEKAATRSVGVRKRPRGGDGGDEDGDPANQAEGHAEFDKIDVDAAVQSLFKRPRQWGRDSRRMPGGGSGGGGGGEDLDSLLSSALAKPAKKEAIVKNEDGGAAATQENRDEAQTTPTAQPTTKIKQEEGERGAQDAARPDEDRKPAEEEPALAGAGLFKKRKAKAGRHK